MELGRNRKCAAVNHISVIIIGMKDENDGKENKELLLAKDERIEEVGEVRGREMLMKPKNFEKKIRKTRLFFHFKTLNIDVLGE